MTLIQTPTGSAKAIPLRQPEGEVVFWLTGAATVADASSQGINLGAVGRESLGTYELTWQDAATEGANGLGAPSQTRFQIIEETAGVFELYIIDNSQTVATDAIYSSELEVNLDTSGDMTGAGLFHFGVLIAAGVTVVNGDGLSFGNRISAIGDLVIMNADNTNIDRYRLRRVN